MKLLAIDGNSVVNRAFYGVRLLQNKSGMYTNAIFGFLNILFKLQADYPSDCVAIAFDLRAPTFRHKQYADYKGTRKGMPEELAMQMQPLKDLLTALGYTLLSLEGYEADDILGTLARFGDSHDMQTVIATGDRDALQLITDDTAVCLIKTKENIHYTPAVFQEQYGLDPMKLVDLKALMGDSSDNIPGVKGIGEKGAMKLIQESGSLDALYQNIDQITATPRIKKLLQEGREMAKLSYELATICTAVPIELSCELLQLKPIDRQTTVDQLTALELFSFVKKLKLDGVTATVTEEKTPQQAAPMTVKTDCTVADIQNKVEADKRITMLVTDKLYLSCPDQLLVCDEVESALDYLLSTDFPKRVYDAKPLYHRQLKQDLTIKNLTFDLTIAAYLLNASAKGYELDSLVQKYLPYQSFPCSESALCSLCDLLASEVDAQEMTALMTDIELPLCEVLASMELEGFALDEQKLTSYGEQLATEIERLREELFTLAEHPFNPNSTKELGVILFEELGLPAGKKTKTGYSTNAEVLDNLRGAHPIIEVLLQYRRLAKLHSTYIVGLQKVVAEDGRVHTTFKQTETRTGRISSTEPNVQNIPVRTQEGEKMREFFVAREGFVLVDADYSQIELRILAAMADDTNMKRAFVEDIDIHQMTASEVLHVPMQEVTAKQRSWAKAINFGIVYGIGAFSLSQDIHVSVYEAKEYIDAYLNTYYGVRQYMDDVVDFAKEHNYVKTLYQRRRDLADINNSNKRVQANAKRIALNTPIQGTAADIIKIAMIRVYQRLRAEDLDARLILQVHDELIIEASALQASRVAQLLKEEMQQAANLSVPLLVDVHTGNNWLQAKG